MHRLLLSALLAATVVALVALPGNASLAQSSQDPGEGRESEPAGESAVALVIDTGEEIKRVCVRFPESELSGIELLRRAGVDPEFAEYSIGTAVCSLCGVGCPSSNCFCESERTGRYWNYSRSTDAGWERSMLGASETTVRHGDVEGWAWGTEGATPPWSEWSTICFTPPSAATESEASGTGSAASEPEPAVSGPDPRPPAGSPGGATETPASGPVMGMREPTAAASPRTGPPRTGTAGEAFQGSEPPTVLGAPASASGEPPSGDRRALVWLGALGAVLAVLYAAARRGRAGRTR